MNERIQESDRKLLEYAAKAAGEWPSPEPFEHVLARWNPLTDDGAALRLAVRCAQRFGFYRFMRAWLIAMATEQGDPSDPLAATRRAITRAAAEIGRNMK
jgi:hypothetical protein